jgi:hypothetical protein
MYHVLIESNINVSLTVALPFNQCRDIFKDGWGYCNFVEVSDTILSEEIKRQFRW